MSKLTALISIAALAGLGYYIGKKVIEKRNAEEEERASHIYEDDSELFVEEHHSTPKEKIQKASLFAVGAIKTGTEKFKEGIDDIINNDMVTKGEQTIEETKTFASEKKDQAVEFAKNTAGNVKDGIENIRNKVTQKAEDAADAVSDGAEELAEAIEQAADEAAEKPIQLEEQIAAADPEPVVEQFTEAVSGFTGAVEDKAEDIAGTFTEIRDEVTEAADDINSISIDSVGADSVETFDFSNPEQL